MKITDFVIVEIGREKGASALYYSGLTDEIMKKLLIEALPLGNPENKVFKIITVDDELFLSSLLLANNEDHGYALIVKLDAEFLKLNPIGFLNSMNNVLSAILKDDNNTYLKELNLEYTAPEFTAAAYENFDNFIFSVLTQQKTLIVGEQEELSNFLANLYEYIPDELKRHITLIANSSNLTNNVSLHALPVTDEVLKIIDGKQGEYTVLFLPMKTAYGTFTSPFCKKIAELFAEQKKESIKEELMQFFKLAIESSDIIPPADFASQQNMSLADASLLLWMRSNHFEIEVQKSLLEQLQ